MDFLVIEVANGNYFQIGFPSTYQPGLVIALADPYYVGPDTNSPLKANRFETYEAAMVEVTRLNKVSTQEVA